MSTPSTDLAVPGLTAEEIELLQAQQEDEFTDASLFTTPILKIGQPLTREVEAGDAESGEFINTLTGDGLGTKIGFIVSFYNRGRFAVDKATRRAYVAFSETIPEAWADLVGEEFVGTPFAEYPDAEEQYKARVNRKEIEWSHGPLVSTTHNFTGFAVVSPPEGSDEPDDLQPVRLSLQRTNMPAVRKFLTIKRAILRNKPFWDLVFDLGTERREFKQGTAHLLVVRSGRATDVEEKVQAAELAQAVVAGRVQSNEEAAQDEKVEPKATGGASF